MNAAVHLGLAVALALLCANASRSADRTPEAISGVTITRSVITVPRPDILSGTESGKDSIQNCHLYDRYAAIEIDSREKGAHSIVLRKRPAGTDTRTLCSTAAVPGEVTLKPEDHYVLGMVTGTAGDFLVTESSDAFGDLATLWVYDASNGKQLREIVYNRNRPVRFAVRPGKTLSVEFRAPLTLKCSLHKDGKTCWSRTLKENRAPQGLSAPDCSAVFKTADSSLLAKTEAIQVTAPARILDIKAGPATRNGSLQFVAGKTTCSETP